jgi:hypothetical protein
MQPTRTRELHLSVYKNDSAKYLSKRLDPS